MAMRSLVGGMLTPLPRRLAGYATKTSPQVPSRRALASMTPKQKQKTSESLQDAGLDRPRKAPFQLDGKFYDDLFRAAAGWATLAYIVGSSVHTLLSN